MLSYNTFKAAAQPLVLLAFIISSCTISIAQAESEPTAKHYTGKPYILENERQPFYIELNNPTSSDLRIVKATVSFSANVEVRGLDRSCSQWRPGNATQIICTVPTLKAKSSKLLSYYVVGDIGLRPGFRAELGVSSLDGSFTIDEQSTETEGIADNDPSIEGSSLEIYVARDILRDTDNDGVSDINEYLQATNPNDPQSLSNANAIIDVAILVSEEADAYYTGKIGGRVESLIARTNQVFRHNQIGITLRLVALGRVEYSGSSIQAALDELADGSNVAFEDLDTIISGVGADLVIFAHTLYTGTETSGLCARAYSNSNAIQGDFYSEEYSRRMLSVVDVSNKCKNLDSFAALIALNMGVVTSRTEDIEGGTFSFSSGLVKDGAFATFLPSGVQLSQPLSPNTTRLSLFSSPTRLCRGQPCGIDKADLAKGADAVFSLNATNHIVADLAPRVFPLTALDKQTKITIDAENSNALKVRQFPGSDSAVAGDWVPIQVEAINDSSITLHNLEFRFSTTSAVSALRTDDNQCAILADSDTELLSSSSSSIEGQGDIVCYVLALTPGQKAGFNYTARMERGQLFPDIHFRNAFVNNVRMENSEACITLVESPGSPFNPSSCAGIVAWLDFQFSRSNSLARINSALLPQLNSSVLTVPFVRLSDGGLVSVQLELDQVTKSIYEVVDINFLDSTSFPLVESVFSADGILTIKNLVVNGVSTTLNLRYVEGSDPPLFLK